MVELRVAWLVDDVTKLLILTTGILLLVTALRVAVIPH